MEKYVTKFGVSAFALPVALALSASPAAADSFKKATPQLLEKGKAAYSANCVVCHGEKGDGNGVAGAGMNPKPRNFMKDKFKKGDKPEQVQESIAKGLPGTSMTAFGFLSEEDRWAITHYVLALRKGGK